MSKGRVLIVDDKPDMRSTLSGLLSDREYLVRSAASLPEALQLLQTERFHVAVLDVRLDDSDEDNQDGLSLMRAINEIDPSVAVIILTGYATVRMVQEALQPDAEGRSPAYSFLEKTEITRLPAQVRGAFDNALRINDALVIEDPENFIPRVANKIRFVSTARPGAEQVAEETGEILRKLFYECERIEVRPMKRGYSGAAVLAVTPWYRGRGRGEVRVAKIGEHGLVEKERNKYRQLVQGIVGGYRLPQTLQFARTRSLSGILYTFAGLGASRDFAVFYREADLSRVLSALDNLFLRTCFPWRRGEITLCPDLDLRETYMKLLRLKPEVMHCSLEHMLAGRHPFRLEGQTIWLGSDIPLTDPIEFALFADLRADTQIAIIHGDLYGYNVLVDERDETWLIDFAATDRGPLLQDYASFETFTRFLLVDSNDWQQLYEWAALSYGAADLSRVELPPRLAAIPEIAKAHAVIQRIRTLALSDLDSAAQRSYLIGVLFNAIKVLTVMNMEPTCRDHALITAAVVAERLCHEGKTSSL